MNTGGVSKLLGVSTSTIQRWGKQLQLELEKNELGYYLYRKEDIEALKNFQVQVQKSSYPQENKIKRRTRRGTTKVAENRSEHHQLIDKINKLEQELNQKADSVVSYQLLLQRQEIEELQTQLEKLQRLLEDILHSKAFQPPTKNNEPSIQSERRQKKSMLRSFFS